MSTRLGQPICPSGAYHVPVIGAKSLADTRSNPQVSRQVGPLWNRMLTNTWQADNKLAQQFTLSHLATFVISRHRANLYMSHCASEHSNSEHLITMLNPAGLAIRGWPSWVNLYNQTHKATQTAQHSLPGLKHDCRSAILNDVVTKRPCGAV